MRGQAPDRETLRALWSVRDTRQKLLTTLHEASVYPDVLAEVLERSDSDPFDLLGQIAYNSPIRSRSERATAFVNREQRFIEGHGVQAREVILALVDKYRAYGIDEAARRESLRSESLSERWGQALV